MTIGHDNGAPAQEVTLTPDKAGVAGRAGRSWCPHRPPALTVSSGGSVWPPPGACGSSRGLTATSSAARFEQTGEYVVGHGAALYRPFIPDAARQSRGYICTKQNNFSECDVVFEATFDVQMAARTRPTAPTDFFGIGDGVPNSLSTTRSVAGWSWRSASTTDWLAVGCAAPIAHPSPEAAADKQ